MSDSLSSITVSKCVIFCKDLMWDSKLSRNILPNFPGENQLQISLSLWLWLSHYYFQTQSHGYGFSVFPSRASWTALIFHCIVFISTNYFSFLILLSTIWDSHFLMYDIMYVFGNDVLRKIFNEEWKAWLKNRKNNGNLKVNLGWLRN